MRITGGRWRSRRLRGPTKKMPVRPTPDSLRERAFSVLGDRTLDAVVLDLFAGTGAVGLEALSRNARRAVFVENHRGVARVLRDNCAAFELDEDRALVMVQPALSAIATLHRQGHRFHLVWADPPFGSWEDGLEAIVEAFSKSLLAPGGTACLECPEHADVESRLPEDLNLVRDLGGGASRLVIIRRHSE